VGHKSYKKNSSKWSFINWAYKTV